MGGGSRQPGSLSHRDHPLHGAALQPVPAGTGGADPFGVQRHPDAGGNRLLWGAGGLRYQSLCFTGMKDRRGVYAVIGKDENRDKEVRRPRASIRKQLSETKQAQAPKKAPARSKSNELEV